MPPLSVFGRLEFSLNVQDYFLVADTVFKAGKGCVGLLKVGDKDFFGLEYRGAFERLRRCFIIHIGSPCFRR